MQVRSIADLLNLARTVIDYIKVAKGAEKRQQELLGAIETTKDLISNFQEKESAETWMATMHRLKSPQGALDQFQSLLKFLELELRPAERTAVSKFRITEEQVHQIISKIDRINVLILVAVQILHMFSALEAPLIIAI